MSNNTEYNLGFDDGLAFGKAEADALRAEVERLSYDGIHTCHDGCPRLPCVQRREIERLEAELKQLAVQAIHCCVGYATEKPDVTDAMNVLCDYACAALSETMP